MSMKVEIDSLDAELLSILRKSKAMRSMHWDSTIKDGVVLKVDITYPLASEIPAKAIDAVNQCIAECVKAFEERPAPAHDGDQS